MTGGRGWRWKHTFKISLVSPVLSLNPKDPKFKGVCNEEWDSNGQLLEDDNSQNPC